MSLPSFKTWTKEQDDMILNIWYQIYKGKKVGKSSNYLDFFLRSKQYGIEKLVPRVWYPWEAPMAAILDCARLHLCYWLPENWGMPIFSVVSHFRYVEVNNRSLHFWYYRFQDSHHPWIWCKIGVVHYRFSLTIAITSRIPLTSSAQILNWMPQ